MDIANRIKPLVEEIAFKSVEIDEPLYTSNLIDSKDKYTNYRKMFFKARFNNSVSGEVESLWPERWTVEELNEMERLKPETFAKEMQGDPSSGFVRDYKQR